MRNKIKFIIFGNFLILIFSGCLGKGLNPQALLTSITSKGVTRAPTPIPLPWVGSKQLGVTGAYDTEAQNIASDSSGNIYISGFTRGAIDGQLKTSNATYKDFFITKYDSSGTKVWTRQLGIPGAFDTFPRGLATDSSGNTFIVGFTLGALDSQAKTSDAISNDFFITKYDTSGVKIWTKQLGIAGTFNTYGLSVTTDSSGNAYLTGYTDGALDSQSKISAASYNDFFITKYNSLGTKLWTKQFGIAGLFNSLAFGISSDSSGGLFIVGYTDGALDSQPKISAVSYSDFFITKYDPSGTRIWTRQLGVGGSFNTQAHGVTTDSNGNIFVGGYTVGAIDSQVKISNAGSNDSFITKFATSGTRAWTRQLGATGAYDTLSQSVSSDSSGNLFIAGYTKGALDSQTRFSTLGNNDFFLTKYDASGAKFWTRLLGVAGASDTVAYGVTTDSSGSAFVGGYTNGALDSQTKFSNVGNHDFFISKYNSSGAKQ